MREKSIAVPSTDSLVEFSWIVFNLIGFLLAGSNILLRVNFVNLGDLSNPFPFDFYGLTISAVNGLLFAGMQAIFFSIFCQNQPKVRWFIYSFVAFLIASVISWNILNLFIRVNEIFYMQIEAWELNVFISPNPLIGLLVYVKNNPFAVGFLTAITSLLLGTVYGALIGIFQSAAILSKDYKKKWIFSVTRIWGLGYMINSLLFTAATLALHTNPLRNFWFVFCILMGLIYSFATRKLIVDILKMNILK